MDGIILCQSKYGASKKYAEWLSQDTGFKITETKKADIKDVAKYDTIILGGGVYASSIAGIQFLKKNIATLKGKNIYVYCCGMAPYSEEVFEILKNKNLGSEMADVPFFYYRGMWDMNDMNLADKAMLKLYVKMLEKKDPSELKDYDRPILEFKDKKMDWTDKEHLGSLLELIRSKGE
jgi:menaquinone-dependent protoporphyrinogen IX oxidase